MINDEFRQDTLHCQQCFQGHKLAFQSVVVNIHTTGFKMQKFYVLPTGCISLFCTDLGRNSDYFRMQR